MSSPKAFLSYVTENRDSIEHLDKDLTDYGIDVVTNYQYVSGGDNWKNRIRNLIYESGYFIACFSKEFNEREESVAYRELDYAIERASDFPPNRKWIIPVRINECTIPNREIRPGVMLTDLNWTDLFPNAKWDDGVKGIVKALGIEPVNRSENVSPITSIEPVNRSENVSPITSIEPVNRSENVSPTTSIEPVNRSENVSPTTSIEPVNRSENVSPTTSIEPVNESENVSPTTKLRKPLTSTNVIKILQGIGFDMRKYTPIDPFAPNALQGEYWSQSDWFIVSPEKFPKLPNYITAIAAGNCEGILSEIRFSLSINDHSDKDNAYDSLTEKCNQFCIELCESSLSDAIRHDLNQSKNSFTHDKKIRAHTIYTDNDDRLEGININMHNQVYHQSPMDEKPVRFGFHITRFSFIL